MYRDDRGENGNAAQDGEGGLNADEVIELVGSECGEVEDGDAGAEQASGELSLAALERPLADGDEGDAGHPREAHAKQRTDPVAIE